MDITPFQKTLDDSPDMKSEAKKV